MEFTGTINDICNDVCSSPWGHSWEQFHSLTYYVAGACPSRDRSPHSDYPPSEPIIVKFCPRCHPRNLLSLRGVLERENYNRHSTLRSTWSNRSVGVRIRSRSRMASGRFTVSQRIRPFMHEELTPYSLPRGMIESMLLGRVVVSAKQQAAVFEGTRLSEFFH